MGKRCRSPKQSVSPLVLHKAPLPQHLGKNPQSLAGVANGNLFLNLQWNSPDFVTAGDSNLSLRGILLPEKLDTIK